MQLQKLLGSNNNPLVHGGCHYSGTNSLVGKRLYKNAITIIAHLKTLTEALKLIVLSAVIRTAAYMTSFTGESGLPLQG